VCNQLCREPVESEADADAKPCSPNASDAGSAQPDGGLDVDRRTAKDAGTGTKRGRKGLPGDKCMARYQVRSARGSV